MCLAFCNEKTFRQRERERERERERGRWPHIGPEDAICEGHFTIIVDKLAIIILRCLYLTTGKVRWHSKWKSKMEKKKNLPFRDILLCLFHCLCHFTLPFGFRLRLVHKCLNSVRFVIYCAAIHIYVLESVCMQANPHSSSVPPAANQCVPHYILIHCTCGPIKTSRNLMWESCDMKKCQNKLYVWFCFS